MIDRLGPSISWLLMIIGGIEGPLPIQTEVVALGGIPTVFLSTIIVPPMRFQFTIWGSLKTCAVLCTKPVMISLWRSAHTACKVLPLVATPSTVIWLIGRMTAKMIAGIFQLLNNLSGYFPLVLSVAVTFLPFFVTSVNTYHLIAFLIVIGVIFV